MPSNSEQCVLLFRSLGKVCRGSGFHSYVHLVHLIRLESSFVFIDFTESAHLFQLEFPDKSVGVLDTIGIYAKLAPLRMGVERSYDDGAPLLFNELSSIIDVGLLELPWFDKMLLDRFSLKYSIPPEFYLRCSLQLIQSVLQSVGLLHSTIELMSYRLSISLRKV